MVSNIPPRTMRNIWDEEKKRRGSRLMQRPTHHGMTIHNTIQKYSNQVNSYRTAGTSGALYKKGRLEFQSVQGQPRNIYRAGGGQGTIYPKKKSEGNVSRTKNALNLPSFKLDQIIEDAETKIFETGEKISVIVERCLDEVTNVFYDAAKEEVVVHADKDYSIPLKLKKVNTKTLEWSYNNGVIEIIFQKK